MKVRQIVRTNSFPLASRFGSDTLLIFDKVLLKNQKAKKWIYSFSVRYGVQSGEQLKSLEKFSGHIQKIAQLTEKLSSRKLKIVVVGGGTVGDFAGFVASVYKRGVELHQIPSTWLAAMDSAHGGKNGLNVAGAKNQIGTIYFAKRIYLVKPLLFSQPSERIIDASGELLKMALISGGKLWKQIQSQKSLSGEMVWKLLPAVIVAKNKIVQKDPYEKSGYRHTLNLGHTMGHVFEAARNLSHGQSVAYGLVFSAAWSRSLGLIKAQQYERIIQCPLWSPFILSGEYQNLLKIRPAQIHKLLQKDKKKTQSSALRFVFIKQPGQTVIREILIADILKEVLRQNRLLKDYHA